LFAEHDIRLDLIVSAWAADLSDKTRAGKSYVVFGKQEPAVMADKLIVALSCLPNTTYDLPAGKSSAGKSYIVFGKQDTDAINLSDIVAGKGGFVINGKSVRSLNRCYKHR
jgi:hypothetical protein